MAVQFDIGEDKEFFLGEDKVVRFPIVDDDGVPLDFATWGLEFIVRKTDKAKDPAIIYKSTTNGGIVITGVYNIDSEINTQRAVITFDSEDTEFLKPITYRHSLKRTDIGSEGILSYGDFVLLQATAH
jgi:hypothetical protein